VCGSEPDGRRDCKAKHQFVNKKIPLIIVMGGKNVYGGEGIISSVSIAI
jgi:hypothetical protein